MEKETDQSVTEQNDGKPGNFRHNLTHSDNLALRRSKRFRKKVNIMKNFDTLSQMSGF